MAIHDHVLAAAQRLCASRGHWTFSPDEIVRALPHLNAQSVRTHVTSRCCVNAAPHHQSRLDYFRRIARGRYEVLPRYRVRTGVKRAKGPSSSGPERVARDTIHAVITRSDGAYVADCLEVSVVTQGRTLDETLANLNEAIALHLEGEDLAALGFGKVRRIHVTYELTPSIDAA